MDKAGLLICDEGGPFCFKPSSARLLYQVTANRDE
jgi:hypothetical protein